MLLNLSPLGRKKAHLGQVVEIAFSKRWFPCNVNSYYRKVLPAAICTSCRIYLH
jgi:hypothetical protein